MINQLGHTRISIDQAIGKLDRVRGGIANPVDAFYGCDVMDQ